jgi:hypothetical protein
MLHVACWTLYAARCMLYVASCMLHVAANGSHLFERTPALEVLNPNRICRTALDPVAHSVGLHAACNKHATRDVQHATRTIYTQHATCNIVGLRVKSHGYFGTARAGASLHAICVAWQDDLRIVVRLCAQRRQQCASARCSLRHRQQTHTGVFDTLLACLFSGR